MQKYEEQEIWSNVSTESGIFVGSFQNEPNTPILNHPITTDAVYQDFDGGDWEWVDGAFEGIYHY